MRYHCYKCSKSVSSELSNDSVIRAVLICPECIEAGKIIFPEEECPELESHEPIQMNLFDQLEKEEKET